MTAWQRVRRALLGLAVAIFALRTLGQIEVALLAPSWLGPMCFWYSGLVPYPVLLPVQIGLLMAMALVTYQHVVDRGVAVARRRITRKLLIGAGAIYAGVMAIRLLLALALTDGACGYGLIPITTHWILAGYVGLLGLAPPRRFRL